MSKHGKKDAAGNKEVVPTVEKRPALTVEEARKFILSDYKVEGYLAKDLLQLTNELLPRVNADKGENKAVMEESQEVLNRVFLSLGIETHAGLMECFSKRYWGMATELSSQVIKEYECTTHAEKMLAESAVGAFMRYLDASRRLNNCLDVDLYITPNKTAYMAMLSKERDRAHRQFLNSLATLKQFKAPAIEMNIKSNTAFIAQNQQINVPPTQP